MTKRIENTAFGGNVSKMSMKIKSMVQVIAEDTVVFTDDATATSKEVKKELDRCGFHYWSTQY